MILKRDRDQEEYETFVDFIQTIQKQKSFIIKPLKSEMENNILPSLKS